MGTGGVGGSGEWEGGGGDRGGARGKVGCVEAV